MVKRLLGFLLALTLPVWGAGEGTVPNPSSAGGLIPNTSNLNQPLSNLNQPLANGSGDSSQASITQPQQQQQQAQQPAQTNAATASQPSDSSSTNAASGQQSATGATQSTTPTGQTMKVYSTAYSPAESGTDPDTLAGRDAVGGQIAYGTHFTVDNPAINSAAIADGAPTDGNGNAIFTATDTGSAVVSNEAANANGYRDLGSTVDFYGSNSSAYKAFSNATSTPVNINIIKAS